MKTMALMLLATVLSIPAFANDSALVLQNAIAGSQRSDLHKQRDKYRHPDETLKFFDVRDDMTVVEIWPGGEGWYTEILAPYLKAKGKLYAAHFSPNSDSAYVQKNYRKFIDKIRQSPDVYGTVTVTVLQPPKAMDIAPDDSADRVLTFRNAHNWMRDGHAEMVFAAMFKALKPGGILGVVEHRGDPNKPQDPKAASGYVTEDTVIALAAKAGFKLLGRSEINANSKDSKDYPEGVWTLPPALRLKEKDQEKYLAIGESDRMTLKFIKPAQSYAQDRP